MTPTTDKYEVHEDEARCKLILKLYCTLEKPKSPDQSLEDSAAENCTFQPEGVGIHGSLTNQ